MGGDRTQEETVTRPEEDSIVGNLRGYFLFYF